MPTFAVSYTYTDDDAGRDERRPEHLEYLNQLAEQGYNLAAGKFGPGEDAGALLLFAAESKADAIALTENDQYWIHGFISEVKVRAWTPAVGNLAEHLSAEGA